MEQSPGSHYDTSTLPSALLISQLSVDRFSNIDWLERLIPQWVFGFPKQHLFCWYCHAPGITSRRTMCCSMLRFAHEYRRGSLQSMRALHDYLRLLCFTLLSSFWESPPFTFETVVNALLNPFPVFLYPQ